MSGILAITGILIILFYVWVKEVQSERDMKERAPYLIAKLKRLRGEMRSRRKEVKIVTRKLTALKQAEAVKSWQKREEEIHWV